MKKILFKAVLLASVFACFNTYSGTAVQGLKNRLESLLKELNSDSFKTLDEFMVSDTNFDLLKKRIIEFGKFDTVNCYVSHSSEVFFGFVCHVTYNKHKSGNNIIFYIFKEDEKYTGTRMWILDMLGTPEQCLDDLSVKPGLSGEVDFKITECKK